jgi:hypothetical protein
MSASIPRKDITADEISWLQQYLKYHAGQVIDTDPDARKAAASLVSSLGENPPDGYIQGWVESAQGTVMGVAAEIVENAERTVADLPEGSDEEIDEAELDELSTLYDRLLELADRVGDDDDLSAADMETLLAAAEAEVITLTFENDSVSFETQGDGDITLASSAVEQ